ncbi:hypothetical protein Tco_0105166 [Tanacetum coccineum]
MPRSVNNSIVLNVAHLRLISLMIQRVSTICCKHGSGVPGDGSRVHTHDHDGSEAPDESPDSILSSEPKPLGKHRPPPLPSILSPGESSKVELSPTLESGAKGGQIQLCREAAQLWISILRSTSGGMYGDCGSGYKWKPKVQNDNALASNSLSLDSTSRSTTNSELLHIMGSNLSISPSSSKSFADHKNHPIHHRLWMHKAHDKKSQLAV